MFLFWGVGGQGGAFDDGPIKVSPSKHDFGYTCPC
jgi:hypothetical protein